MGFAALGLFWSGDAPPMAGLQTSNSAQQTEAVAEQQGGDGMPTSAPGLEPIHDPLAALAHGQLVVWVLQPSAAAPSGNAGTAPAPAPRSGPAPTYKEQDAGTFGQTAGSFGHDAASYGAPSDTSKISAPPSGTGYHQQTAGSFAQPSSDFGTPASDYGQTAGNFGQTAGSFGMDSSNTGQTAGSFGNSLGTLATAGIHPALPARSLTPQQSEQIRDLGEQVRLAFPDLHVRYVSVEPAELEARLNEASHSGHYPDLLVAVAPGDWWRAATREFALATLRNAVFYADGVTQRATPPYRVAVLAQAPHRLAAQAFALWIVESRSGCAGCVTQNLSGNSRAAAAVAVSALSHLLEGQSLGDEADPAMATFSPQLGPAMLTDSAGSLPKATPVHFDLMHASATGRLAVVALRVTAASSNVFALAHPLVVLRRDRDGRWRVLHVSLNLPPSQQQDEREMLIRSIAVASERPSAVRGILQASPVDGDTRPPNPELWWDNAGGASLQVVEWQIRSGGAWSDPHLYLAPDVGSRLRTQVTARFASTSGTYRWRVWSVGSHGETKISSWSTLNIVE
jgi:hypothetical protein